MAWVALFIFSAVQGQAQWITQTLPLHPGWNAVYLHVDATHDSLENLVGTDSPISEIWRWQPNLTEGRIISNVSAPVSGSDWLPWTRAQGPANAFSLNANSTYLVRNTNATTSYSWNLKGKPVPPSVSWTASGLNFFGFATPASTPADSAPFFANFLAPSGASTFFDIFYYVGGEAADASPNTGHLTSTATVRVSRGQAFWIQKTDQSDNRYYGPFEVVLQNYRGIAFSEASGSYSFRLRNQLSTINSVTATLLASETSPGGDTLTTPPLLLRNASINITDLTYGFTSLPVGQPASFVLAPKGKPGSEVEVVLGLDRANMSGTSGASFAGILRLKDITRGHLQVDLPVTATQASTEGLWVGNASITKVGNYLKTYAKATNAVDFASQTNELKALNQANATVNLADGLWTSRSPASISGATWSCLASSADGAKLVAGKDGGNLYTSENSGTNWAASLTAPATKWQAVASSTNGVRLVAAVSVGQLYTSGDSGATWTAQSGAPAANWHSVASSADGQRLIAVIAGGDIYTSADAGLNWTHRFPVSNENWHAVASSADGTNLLAAIHGGRLHASMDAGGTWLPLFGAPSANWLAVASSADGRRLFAAADAGGLYTSIDSGATWNLKTNAPISASWVAVASSANGVALVAAVNGGLIYTSNDAGTTWIPGELSRPWSALASSAAGTGLVAAESGGNDRLYSITGTLSTPVLDYDSATGNIMTAGGKYLTATFDTALGAVRSPFSLRLIVHQDNGGTNRLLQRVFAGTGVDGTNPILTLQQTNLHSGLLASARRISAVHLPWTTSGGSWQLEGTFGGVGIITAVIKEDFGNHPSNPFLHSYHPDHDNLDALFGTLATGQESYDIERQVTLAFTPPGEAFASRTAGSSLVQGTYLENIVIKGSANQTRTVVTQGIFVLNRVSSISTIQ